MCDILPDEDIKTSLQTESNSVAHLAEGPFIKDVKKVKGKGFPLQARL